nr:hypothetical protein Q903MT_gene2041 [Picea sitchensis]
MMRLLDGMAGWIRKRVGENPHYTKLASSLVLAIRNILLFFLTSLVL